MDWSAIFTPETTWMLISAVLGIVTLLLSVLAGQLTRWKNTVIQITEAVDAYREGKHPSSELGIKLSEREKTDIQQETIDVVEAIAKTTTAGLLERVLLQLINALRKIKPW